MSLPTLAVGVVEEFKKDKRKKKQRDLDEYVPENEKESEDDWLESKPKVCHTFNIYTSLSAVF